MSENGVSRRHFFLSSAATLVAGHMLAQTITRTRARYRSPNEKLNIAAIGAGGQGAGDISECESENIVALCDVDWKSAAESFRKYPKARQYKDFRVMFDKEKSLDAVTVSTPDHSHAVAALWAVERGIHVYVQKPLTHTIYEARMLTDAAQQYGVVTQMGNQGHGGEGVRKLCEMIWSGAIGDVREVHAWTNRPIWPQGIEQPLPEEPVPQTLDWETWIGPAPMRPYNSGYAPFNWRGWFDFGCGALGDMACHILDPANWALQLGAPSSVECVRQEGKNDQTYPTKSIIRYEFPARGAFSPVMLYWYDGGFLPPLPRGISGTTKLGDGDNGSLFIGSKGIVTVGCYGDDPRLLPEGLMKEYTFPHAMLPRSPGHYREWIQACKGGPASLSNFNYAGPFTEWVLLGTIAVRYQGKLVWESEKMEFSNFPEANQWVRRPYRKGWEMPSYGL
jgi:predicted dehydrogenase